MTSKESESRLSIAWWAALMCATALGAIVCPSLASSGLRQLGESRPWSAAPLAVASLAGAAAAGLGVQAARGPGPGWWWLPALLTWAVTITAAATCDALTQRVPTPLLQAGALVTTLLVLIAGLVTQDWRGLGLTFVACAGGAAILAVCWRFAGAGFGDVRLATAGGLGLGHAMHRSLVLGVLAVMVLTMTQAIWTYVRTHDRKAHFAYGPGLAVGFLIAAAV